MRYWIAIVDETVERKVRYTVEAETLDEANELFLSGETVDEKDLQEEVTGRRPHATTEITKSRTEL